VSEDGVITIAIDVVKPVMVTVVADASQELAATAVVAVVNVVSAT
jgi:hypothetical protein